MATKIDDLLSEFRAELKRLAPAVELVDGMSGYVELVRERAETIRKETERAFKEMEDIAKNNLEDSKKALEDFSEQKQQEIEPLLKSLAAKLQELNRLVDFLKNADIPGRLDRTEVRIDNLNTSIQNIFGRLDFLELNLREEMKKTQGSMEAIEGRIKGFKNITVMLLILNILLTFGTLVALFVRR